MDDFSQEVLGPGDEIRLPLIGEEIRHLTEKDDSPGPAWRPAFVNCLPGDPPNSPFTTSSVRFIPADEVVQEKGHGAPCLFLNAHCFRCQYR